MKSAFVILFVLGFAGIAFAGEKAGSAATSGYGGGGTQHGNYSEPGKSYNPITEQGTVNPYTTPGSRPTLGGNPPYNSGPKTGPSDEEGEEY